jgi:hypothetical protein
MGQQFDELSKALASGMSRRRALWRFAGGLAGAALVSLIPGRTSHAAAGGEALAIRRHKIVINNRIVSTNTNRNVKTNNTNVNIIIRRPISINGTIIR